MTNGTEKQMDDYRRGERITVACIIGNVLLTAFKLLAGIFGRSQAMVSDALHSASDIVATAVVLVGLRIARKPVDSGHPYGHGKVEPIAAAFVGVTLVFAAIVIVAGIVESIAAHTFTEPTVLALGAAVLSIAVKEAMYRVTDAAGRRIGSEAVRADALHHRSDAFSSVATLVGIGGSMAGRWLGIGFLQYLDPIAGAAVACFIFKVAYDILKHAVKGLMDSAPEKEKLRGIHEAAVATEGVCGVSAVKGRYIGHQLFVDMEIEVASALTVEEGHDIAVRARERVLAACADVAEVLVHVEPVPPGGQ